MLITGKELAASIRAPLLQRAQALAAKMGRPLGLFAVGSSDDYGAYVYLNKEVQAAQQLGVRTQLHSVNAGTAAADFLALIIDKYYKQLRKYRLDCPDSSMIKLC